MRPWQAWSIFGLFAAMLLTVMSWTSVEVMRLDRQADVEERVRLSLWRMESLLAPLLARESARPYFVNAAAGRNTRLNNSNSFGNNFGNNFSNNAAPQNTANNGGINWKWDQVYPWPLPGDASPHILLYFQLGPDGVLTSPQLAPATSGTLASPMADQNTMRERVTALRKKLDYQKLDGLISHDNLLKLRIGTVAEAPAVQSRAQAQEADAARKNITTYHLNNGEPDKTTAILKSMIGDQIPATKAAPLAQAVKPYDPTNGTPSAGDIWSGNQSAESLRRDRQRRIAGDQNKNAGAAPAPGNIATIGKIDKAKIGDSPVPATAPLPQGAAGGDIKRRAEAVPPAAQAAKPQSGPVQENLAQPQNQIVLEAEKTEANRPQASQMQRPFSRADRQQQQALSDAEFERRQYMNIQSNNVNNETIAYNYDYNTDPNNAADNIVNDGGGTTAAKGNAASFFENSQASQSQAASNQLGIERLRQDATAAPPMQKTAASASVYKALTVEQAAAKPTTATMGAGSALPFDAAGGSRRGAGFGGSEPARVRGDQRTLSSAIESYYLDLNTNSPQGSSKKPGEDAQVDSNGRLQNNSSPNNGPANNGSPNMIARANVSPMPEFQIGMPQPLWIGDTLLLVRRTMVGGQQYFQGCWLDWESISKMLLEEVRDLLPQARLEPVNEAAETTRKDRMLAALPARLIPGGITGGSSPIRISLRVAWGCLVLAIGAIGMLLAGALTLSERRRTFVSAVTHELRTPLTTFRMYTEMLAGGMITEPEKQARYLKTLHAESGRLTHLVENVLAYARLEAGRPGRRTESIALDELLERVRERLEERAARGLMDLRITAPEEGGLAATQVRADVTGVEQILFNLVDNACKYAAAGGERTIEIEATRVRDKMELRVCDCGPGISPDEARRIFRPFSRSARDAAGNAPGVGLGLALSRRLARAMGGDLRLEIEHERGACFVLALPLR